MSKPGRLRWVFTAGIAAAIVGSAALVPVRAGESVDANRLSWMAGSWTGAHGKLETEEYWIAPKGGCLLGLHRDVAGDRMVSFEYLRIETTPGGLVYVASPKGGPSTPFRLVECGEKRVVFENPEHDFPQRILYWIAEDGAMHARIEGPKDGKTAAMEWRWTRSETGIR
jgi:hypothetical protein